MSENVLLKEILDSFFSSLLTDDSVSKDLIEKLKQLRVQGKIAKGTNLKSLLESLGSEAGDEN